MEFLKNIKGDKALFDEIKSSIKKEKKIKQIKVIEKKINHLDVEDAEIVKPSKTAIDEEVDLNNPIYKVLLELYEKMEKNEKEELLVKA